MACSDVGCSRSFLAVCLFLSTSCGARDEPVDPPALPKAAEPPVRAAEPVAPKPPPITPTAPRWVVYDEHDEGVMCLTTRPPTPIQSAAFQAMRPDPHLAVKKNQSLFAIVDANRCVSSSCSRNKKHTCKVELAGSELRVTSKAHYEVHEGGPCTEDCWPVNASCRTPKLKPGTYTVHHGDKSFSITVPGSLTQACTH